MRDPNCPQSSGSASNLFHARWNRRTPHGAAAITRPPSRQLLVAARGIAAGMRIGRSCRFASGNSDAQGWNCVLVDTPGSFNLLTVSAHLLPIEAALLSAEPLLSMLEGVRQVVEMLNPELQCAGVVACRLRQRANNPREILDLDKRCSWCRLSGEKRRKLLKLSETQNPATGLRGLSRLVEVPLWPFALS